AADRDDARAVSRCLAAGAALVEEVIHAVRRRDHMREAKAVTSGITNEASWRGAPKERSKNGKVSLARRATAALAAGVCGQRRGPMVAAIALERRASRARVWLSQMRKPDNPMWIVTLQGGGQQHCRRSFHAGRRRVHPRQLHADVFRAGSARFRHRALAHA